MPRVHESTFLHINRALDQNRLPISVPRGDLLRGDLSSKTFLAYVLFGECVITGPMLIQSFKHYISADERSLIDKCISGAINFDDADESSDRFVDAR